MNVKPGDMAIVINASVTPEMIGKIVEVVRPAVLNEVFGKNTYSGGIRLTALNGTVWVVRSRGRKLPWTDGQGKIHLLDERPYIDDYLRPVSGLPMDDEEDDEQPIDDIVKELVES